MTDASLDLVVARKRTVADGVCELSLRRPDGGALPAWSPGAHLDLHLAPGLARSYSLCGDPAVRAEWRVAVLREAAGTGGSSYVHDRLTTGDKITASAPRNHFPFEPPSTPPARCLFLAGGIGITPLLPMIARAQAAGTDWRLLYGGRTRASMAYADRLAAHGERVTLRPEDEYGLLDLAGFLEATDAATHVYACGPEALLAAIEVQCRAAGLPEDALHVERFRPAPAEGSSFEVELADSGLTVRVPPGRSILEAVEDTGVQVLSSCRAGTCGTCETEVLSGTPDHRDHLLTEAERSAGDTMLICVSRCHGPRLRLAL
ncbi:PDR/VanB family oxidoreductase [Streptomyces ochraceiscleroticus]|uniref:PDR/VanB family oxidoreductase n=1 Tax=Streptomyces ochraceiscleroticus TaxID=47761 RepID=A0ABW1MTK2_9ACTN|nr:PDR/VanB family oxidoreductase [Streptomyces ochraceiscleroticus]